MNLERLPAWTLIPLALAAGLTCQLLLGTSYIAASLDPLEAEGGVTIAIVVLDQGPHGRELLDRLAAAGGPVTWMGTGSRADALDALARKEAFGALLIPENFSADLDSFASDAPRHAFVERYANPGASTTGNLIASRAIDLALDGLRTTYRERALATTQVGTTGLGALTLEQGRVLAEPLVVGSAVVNPVPRGGVNGLAPTYFAMAAWIGGYLGAVALERFRPVTGLGAGARGLLVVGAALMQAALSVGVAVAIGLSARDTATLTLVIALGTWMAYALVSLLTDLLGLAAVLPAFAVLALGLPASGALYPEGLLPDLYRALHAIDPFTWLVEALRTTLYTPGAGDLAGHMRALAVLALACTAMSLAVDLLRSRRVA